MKSIYKLIGISLTLVCLLSTPSQAQRYSDFSWMFSQHDIHGTARIQGLAGAQTSLGGDISSISGNPAGLGFYNSSEFSISPAFQFNNNSSRYLDNISSNHENQLVIANGGIVINKSLANGTSSGFKGGSFGISVSRSTNFRNQINYLGENTQEDFIDYAVSEANAAGTAAYNNPDLLPELSFLAYQTTLIDRFFDGSNPNDTAFFFDRNIYDILDPDIVAFPSEQFPTLQNEIITTTGAQYQTTFAYGANFSDQFYIGASMGITSLRFEQDRLYTEEPTESDLTRMTLQDYRLLRGTGINGTIGIIYRPVNVFTLGISYTSPTFYELEDESIITMISDFNTGVLTDEVVFLPLRFNLRTPGRLKGGVTLFFEKYGFVTADVEWVDYAGSNFSSNEFSFSDANQQIDRFQSVLNYKVGAEFRYNVARFRAGYSLQGDPLEETGVDRSRQSFTAGLGVHHKEFFADVAYVRSNYDKTASPYSGAPVALIDQTTENIVLTLGMKF